jgi:hypothetical protein
MNRETPSYVFRVPSSFTDPNEGAFFPLRTDPDLLLWGLAWFAQELDHYQTYGRFWPVLYELASFGEPWPDEAVVEQELITLRGAGLSPLNRARHAPQVFCSRRRD